MSPTESKTTGTVGNFPHGSRETPATSASPMEADRSEKARGHKSDMHVAGKSDSPIVPKKPANKGRVPPCGVGGGKGTDQGEHRAIATGPDTEPERGRDTVRNQVARVAGCTGSGTRDKRQKFTNLLHHLTAELLRASFFDLKKQAAPGIDGETWHDYAKDFERRIDDLHGRIHRGAYRAKPSKRRYIPKADGKMRPLGIAALEDKIVQQAARTVLECIYEQDFLGFSYGFRPGRSRHRALDAYLWVSASGR